jgi:hypothetical protein
MKYRTKDGQDYTVPERGRTLKGIIVTDRMIENSNFELVEEVAPAAPVSVPPATSIPPSTPQLAQPASQTNQGSTN